MAEKTPYRTGTKDYAALEKRVLHLWNYDETLSLNRIAIRLGVARSWAGAIVESALEQGATKRTNRRSV